MNNSDLQEEKTTEMTEWEAWCERERKVLIIVSIVFCVVIGVMQIVGLFVNK